MNDYLDIEKLIINQNEGLGISVIYDGNTYNNIQVFRCFPMSEPFKYLSIRLGNEEDKELGIIENPSKLEKTYQDILIDALRRRYYVPEIIKIVGHKNKNGYNIFDCITTAGKKEVIVFDLVWSLSVAVNKAIVLKDVYENLYEIKDYQYSNDKYMKYIRSFV